MRYTFGSNAQPCTAALSLIKALRAARSPGPPAASRAMRPTPPVCSRTPQPHAHGQTPAPRRSGLPPRRSPLSSLQSSLLPTPPSPRCSLGCPFAPRPGTLTQDFPRLGAHRRRHLPRTSVTCLWSLPCPSCRSFCASRTPLSQAMDSGCLLAHRLSPASRRSSGGRGFCLVQRRCLARGQ